MIKTCGGVKALCNRRFDEFNACFTERMEMIEEALDTPGAVIELIIVYLGESIGQHSTNEAEQLVRENAGSLAWKACGFNDVHLWLIDEQTPATVNADFPLQNCARLDEPITAIYGGCNWQPASVWV